LYTSTFLNLEKEKQPTDKETREPIQQKIYLMTIQQRNINVKAYSNINKHDKNPKKSVQQEIENIVTGHHL
jgi:hypothetical protein